MFSSVQEFMCSVDRVAYRIAVGWPFLAGERPPLSGRFGPAAASLAGPVSGSVLDRFGRSAVRGPGCPRRSTASASTSSRFRRARRRAPRQRSTATTRPLGTSACRLRPGSPRPRAVAEANVNAGRHAAYREQEGQQCALGFLDPAHGSPRSPIWPATVADRECGSGPSSAVQVRPCAWRRLSSAAGSSRRPPHPARPRSSVGPIAR